MKLRAFLASLGLVVIWWITWPWPFAVTRAQVAARLDLEMRNYTLVVYGLPAPWARDYYALLSRRYGIRIHRVADCIVSQSLVAYADEYDRISRPAIVRKYGRDIFRECAEEARRNWEIQTAERDSHVK